MTQNQKKKLADVLCDFGKYIATAVPLGYFVADKPGVGYWLSPLPFLAFYLSHTVLSLRNTLRMISLRMASPISVKLRF